MAYRTDNRHSMRFRVRRFLRRLRSSLDEVIDSLIENRSRAAI